jgi:hypothetical protein
MGLYVVTYLLHCAYTYKFKYSTMSIERKKLGKVRIHVSKQFNPSTVFASREIE